MDEETSEKRVRMCLKFASEDDASDDLRIYWLKRAKEIAKNAGLSYGFIDSLAAYYELDM